jgi:hypothetical protein
MNCFNSKHEPKSIEKKAIQVAFRLMIERFPLLKSASVWTQYEEFGL